MDERLSGLIYFTPTDEKSRVIFSKNFGGDIPTIKKEQWQESLKKNLEFTEVEVEKEADIFKIAGKYVGNSDTGFVLFLDKSRTPLSLIKSTLRSQGIIFKYSYILVSGFQNPRWFFPENKKLVQKCSNIVKPSKLKSIIAWNLFLFLNRLGLGRLLFPARIVVAQRNVCKGRLQQYLNDFFGREDLNFIIYTGAYGYFQKFTAQIMDKSGGVIAYAKIGRTEQTKERIRREHETLKRLDGIGFADLDVPKALQLEYMPRSNDLIMIQSPSGGDGQLARTLVVEHIDALVDLFNKTSPGTERGIELLASLSESLCGINRSLLPEEVSIAPERLEILIKRLECELRGVEIPVGLAHGDFSPWNIYLERGKAFVFDWETAQLRVPLWDLYNFIFHSELDIYSKCAHDVFELLTGRQTKYSYLIERYISRTQKNHYYNVSVFLLIFLFEISIWYLRYLTVQLSAGFDEERGEKKFIKAAISIIEEMLQGHDNFESFGRNQK